MELLVISAIWLICLTQAVCLAIYSFLPAYECMFVMPFLFAIKQLYCVKFFFYCISWATNGKERKCNIFQTGERFMLGCPAVENATWLCFF